MDDEIEDMLTSVTFVDSKSKKIFSVNTKTRIKKEMTDNECSRRWKQHAGCGGWFVSVLDLRTFFTSTKCSKCGREEKCTRQ
jgi:hypothetical protein